MSKGSAPRPFKVTNEEYSNRWDAIFGRDNEKTNSTKKNLESGESDRSCDGGRCDNSETPSGQTEDDRVVGS